MGKLLSLAPDAGCNVCTDNAVLLIGGQGISFVAVGPYTVKEAEPLVRRWGRRTGLVVVGGAGLGRN